MKWVNETWVATTSRKGKITDLGAFSTEAEAARAYDIAFLKNGRQDGASLNFPAENYRDLGLGLQSKTKSETKSDYHGVNWKPSLQQWQAKIHVDGVIEDLGHYFAEEDAARAYDNRCAELSRFGKCMNFPTEHGHASPGKEDVWKSCYRGVSWNRKAAKWMARLEHNGATTEIGAFSEEQEAAHAYDARCKDLGLEHLMNPQSPNKPPSNRSKERSPAKARSSPRNGSANASNSASFTAKQNGDLFVFEDDDEDDDGLDDVADSLADNVADNVAHDVAEAEAEAEAEDEDEDDGASLSSYKGISWSSTQKLWLATVRENGTKRILGAFDDEDIAVKVRDAECRRLGQVDELNLPDDAPFKVHTNAS